MKLIAFIFSMSLVGTVFGQEKIIINSPYSPAHGGNAAMLKIIEKANSLQDQFKFALEFKPGGNQAIAVKNIDPTNTLAIVAPAFVENIDSGLLKEQDYIPIWALGDACWVVVVNKPLEGASEFTVGGVGFGNAAHLTSLELGEKFNFKVRYIIFKSNNDALVNMAGNNGVELVIDRFDSYQSMKKINPNINAVAASCPRRIPQDQSLKTLKELGIDAPFIFNILVAHKDMDLQKRTQISNFINQATLSVGAETIYSLSSMRPPVFDGIQIDSFYQKSLKNMRFLQNKHRAKIDAAKNNK